METKKTFTANEVCSLINRCIMTMNFQQETDVRQHIHQREYESDFAPNEYDVLSISNILQVNENCIADILEIYEEAEEAEEKPVTLTIPYLQKLIIQRALADLQSKFMFSDDEDEESQRLLFDIMTLRSLLNYDVTITMTESQSETFTADNKIDLPIYINQTK